MKMLIRRQPFFISSLLFAIGMILQFVINVLYPIPVSLLASYAPGAPITAGLILILLSLLGLAAFFVGIIGLIRRNV